MTVSAILRASIALAPLSLFAQQPARDATARDTLAPAVVTATRLEIRTAAPTSTATVITGASLRAQGIVRIEDAIRLVPGVTVVASGSTGAQTSLFLRGGNSNYVKVLVDGVPLNDAGGAIDLANLTTDNLDRIEVVRGPASVLYGSDAVTGVIQLFTTTGRGALHSHLELGGGSYGTLRADGGVSGSTGPLGYALGASRQSTTGVLPFNNDYHSDDLTGSLRYAPDARTDLRLGMRWSSGDFHYPTNSAGVPVDHNAEQVDHRLVASLDAGRRITDAVELRLLLASNEYLPRSNDGPDSPADTLGFYGFYSRATHTHRSADFRTNIRIERSTLTFGVERADDREQSSSLSLSQYGPSPGGFAASRENTGYYAQAVGDATDRLSFAVGARHDVNSAFGEFTTGRASLAMIVNASLKLRAAYGTSFKAPSFAENFSTGYVLGNPQLEPEQSRGAEVGADFYAFDGALVFGATWYAQTFSNLVQYSGTPLAKNGPNYYNVAGATANGVELEATWRPDAATAVSTSWSHLDTRVTDIGFDSTAGATYVKGGRLIRRPANTIVASVSRAFGSAHLQLTARHVGERDDRDFNNYPATPVTLPAYTRVDASATVPINAGFSAVLRADNLFGATYEEVAHFAAPRAVVYAGIRLER